MIRLFLRECKGISKSLIYIMYILITIAFFISVYTNSFNVNVNKPVYVEDLEKYYEENGKYPYGVTEKKFAEEKSPKVFEEVFKEYQSNKYFRSPLGFVKKKSLNNEGQEKVKEILTQISKCSIDELENAFNNNKTLKEKVDKNIKDNFHEFKENLSSLDKLLGGKSSYSIESLNEYYGVGQPLTYEDALNSYNEFVYKDGVLGAYARPFAYTMSVITSLISVVVVVAIVIKDKKSGMYEIIYSKEISSKLLVTVRYVSLIIMLMLPILALAIFSTISLSSMAKSINPQYDYLAFIKYTVTWIGPTMLVVCALAMLITLLTDTQLGVIIQIIWWFQSINLPSDYFGIEKLILRFNYIGGKRNLLIENRELIIANRVFYTLAAMLLLVISIVVFSMKRSGKLNVRVKSPKIFSNMFNKSKNIMDI